MPETPTHEQLVQTVETLAHRVHQLIDLLEYSHGKPLTEHQVAMRLGVSLRTVKRRIESGKLRAIVDGDVTRIRPADLERYLEKKTTGSEAE